MDFTFLFTNYRWEYQKDPVISKITRSDKEGAFILNLKAQTNRLKLATIIHNIADNKSREHKMTIQIDRLRAKMTFKGSDLEKNQLQIDG